MPSNEVVLIDRYIHDAQRQRDTPLPDAVAFEHFAAQCALRAENLSDEEIGKGIVGGGNDGAIDAVFVFLDGILLDEDADIFSEDFAASKVRKQVSLQLRLIQAKRTDSFTETALDLAASSLDRLLDLNQADAELGQLYSKSIIDKIRLFTRAWTALSIRSPHIEIFFDYVTKGETDNADRKVGVKQRDLENLLSTKVPGATSKVSLIGATELWAITSAVPEYDLQLQFEDYVSKGDSYTGLVTLGQYYKFLSEEDGRLRGHLFDWNVRDYQGEVTVNREMQETLDADTSEDFWWLNNGVTILCSSVGIGGDKTFTLGGVQIVNGMQTSHSVHSAVAKTGAGSDLMTKRSVLVRVVKTQSEEVRDKIIRATNSQTKVPDASLHATENIHRQIEAHFLSKGWFYDRRKNFYKNAGKPADRIMGISALGQAVMAIGLGRPNDARARPSTLLNNATDYRSLFTEKVPLETYFWIASTQRRVDSALLSDSDPYVRSNLRYHVSSYLAVKAYGARIYSPRQLTELSAAPLPLDNDACAKALTRIEGLAASLVFHQGWTLDRTAKSRSFAEAVLESALKDRAQISDSEAEISESDLADEDA